MREIKHYPVDYVHYDGRPQGAEASLMDGEDGWYYLCVLWSDTRPMYVALERGMYLYYPTKDGGWIPDALIKEGDSVRDPMLNMDSCDETWRHHILITTYEEGSAIFARWRSDPDSFLVVRVL